jgi:hypothetical protein
MNTWVRSKVKRTWQKESSQQSGNTVARGHNNEGGVIGESEKERYVRVGKSVQMRKGK